MARRPAHLVALSKKPVGRQGIWQEIRRQRDGFTRTTLATATDIPTATIRTYLIGLRAAGIIEVGATTGTYHLVRDCGVEAPRVTKDGKPVIQGAAREQMWRTMKMLSGDFSSRDLSIAASTEIVTISPEDAKDYCRNLALAGYLQVIVKGHGTGIGAIPSRYRFVRAMNTGPKAPMVQRMQTVFDPNCGKIVWHPEIDS